MSAQLQVACVLAVVCLVSGCSPTQDSEEAARAAVRGRLAAEKARLAAMTLEERAAEEQRKAAAEAEVQKRREEEARRREEKAKETELAQLRAEGLVWDYSTVQDELTGRPVESTLVRSTNTVEFGFPYQEPQRGTLSLRKHPRFGKDVILQIERGQFVCGIDDCNVVVRVDDGPVQQYSVGQPSDHSSTTLFIRNYSRFVGQIGKAKEVRIAATVYQEGSQTFVFNVEGLEWK